MSASATRYFVRTTAGTEALAWVEIDSLLNAQQIRQTARTLEVACADPASKLMLLRSVDDVYVHLGTLFGMDHTDPSLNTLVSKARTLDIESALAVVRTVRHIPSAPSYAITASLESACNYSRFEAAAALRQGLDGLVGWRYIDHRDNKAVADLDIRVLIDGPRATLGIRLGDHPLHRRSYKVASVPGSLKPPVAFCMLMLANPLPNETLLDPMCGAGTFLLEAESNWAPHCILGNDNDPAILAQALSNCTKARSEARLVAADAFQLPLRDGAVDRITSNLPWGRQVVMHMEANHFHAALVAELSRVLRHTGRAVLLTDQVESLLQALDTQLNLHIALAQQISLYGSHPTILVLIKQNRRPDYLHPFIQFRQEDALMSPVVQQALVSNLNHPATSLRLRAARVCLRSKDTLLHQALASYADDPLPQLRDMASSAVSSIA